MRAAVVDAQPKYLSNSETDSRTARPNDDFANLAMLTDVNEELEESYDEHVINALSGVLTTCNVSGTKNTEAEQSRAAREEARDSILQAFPDPPILIAQTANKLRAYISDIASSGGALTLDERIRSYCKTERITTEPMSQVLIEMEKAQLLNKTGRNLLAVTDQNPQQRWKDFLRVLVTSARGNRAHEKASTVIEGLNRSKMVAALSYAMSMPLGLKIATDTQKYLLAEGPPTRTVTDVFRNAVLGLSLIHI